MHYKPMIDLHVLSTLRLTSVVEQGVILTFYFSDYNLQGVVNLATNIEFSFQKYDLKKRIKFMITMSGDFIKLRLGQTDYKQCLGKI